MSEFDLLDEKMKLFESAVKETLNWCEENKHHSTVKVNPADQINLLQLVLVLVNEIRVKNGRIEQLEKAMQEAIESIHCGNRKLAYSILREALGKEE